MTNNNAHQTTGTSALPALPQGQPRMGRPKRHGMSHSSTYMSWEAMIQRCFDPKHVSYHNHGGRGVTACDHWKLFDNFLADMGERPEGKVLTRIDKNLPYSKSNCKWGSRVDVARNSRKSRYVTAYGETKSLAEWAEDPRCKVTYSVFKSRIRIGMAPEVALTTAQKWEKKKPLPVPQALAA